MTQMFTLLDPITQAVVVPSCGAESEAQAVEQFGGGLVAVPIDRAVDPFKDHWDGEQWVTTCAVLDPILHAKVDEEAGEIRKRYLTTVPGQEMTYLRKEQEARAFMLDPEGSYPFLQAEAQATNVTVAELAAVVLANADIWGEIGAAIEGLRMGAKTAITAATTAADKNAAATVDWDGLLP